MSTAVQKTEKLISRMTRAEKAQVLLWILQGLGDAFSGIGSNPGVAACIVQTRIPVWILEQARSLGATDANLLIAYPSLRAEDLATAWAYVRTHTEEVTLLIVENETY